MNSTYILNFLAEIAYLLFVLGLCLTLAIFKGRQAIINLMVGLYLALLIFIQFPNYDSLFANIESAKTLSMAKLSFFALITLLTTMLASRIMPNGFRENKFESFGKKLLLSIGATILIMTFSFNVLPVTDFLTPGTPIQSLFAVEAYFFWWLLAPLVILYFV